MASSARRSRKKTTASAGRKGSGNSTKAKRTATRTAEESAIASEVILIGIFALTVLLFLCNFGIIGVVGDAVSRVMFGVFGLTAYVVPILAFVAVAFGISNQGNRIAIMKLTAGIVLFFLIGMVCALVTSSAPMMETYSVADLYAECAQNRSGGGVLAGSLVWVLHHFLGMVGTVLFLLVLAVICGVILTERSLVGSVKSSGKRVYESARSDAQLRRERSEKRREEAQVRRQEALEKKEEALARRQEKEQRLREEEARRDAERILRMDRKASGITADTDLKKEAARRSREDIHEITLNDSGQEVTEVHNISPFGRPDQIAQPEGEPEEEQAEFRKAPDDSQPLTEPEEAAGMQEFPGDIESWKEIPAVSTETIQAREADVYRDMKEVSIPQIRQEERLKREEISDRPVAKKATSSHVAGEQSGRAPVATGVAKPQPRPYRFPPLSLLKPPKSKGAGDSGRHLKETAARLQETLLTFGVRVTITDISQGPSVTRYELQPEQGVKVSKILSLADDIKLNLAATDIRIEAPIPGKAAIGIEVPNKENTAVALRELLESKDFREFPSNLAFAVGKDIAGKVVVSDIAKMPHMLIAGATGSGKSVCINTLIMSILYKARPEDVKLILVDPKVVELSVYNGIPHLLIPVVTDPKKASAALQWGVAEMSDRYRKFADFNVRDLKGYNQKVSQMEQKGDPDAPGKLPQIVIIVDELADLMMVAPGEVEESICRLAQLARAAGIHLIIATQRPSVDVITGLIKANMPSRVAFAVSSGVDSRTILDMNGAEKLLGKGDMLFYPQGYSKPARIQGAFVSDGEVSDVVDFLKNQAIGNVYSQDIEEKLKSIGSGQGASAPGTGSERDEYFVEAGQFIIEKDKASIGMLQRAFKIGFNRAARIMDQLAEAGVVGEEEGTKPRKVLMSPEQFEQYIEESV